MWIVGRPINGISINGLEWLLDAEDNLMKFPDRDSAKQFLRDNGVDDEEYLEDGFWYEECE